MTLEIIGAGFGRTGTDSMREALNILGAGPCHHMYEVSGNPVMKSRWRAFMNSDDKDWDDRDWPHLFEGYRSCVDWPSVQYWRDLTDFYPQAKVILTWRDPESWWTSYEATLLRYLLNTDDHASVGYRVLHKTFGARVDDRDHVLGVYRAHVDEVIATIPPERLLVFRLGDDWPPLCDFLNVPVPDRPYPNRNSTADMQAR